MLPERRQRKRKRFADESLSAQDDPNVSQEDHFRNNVFYVLLDCVIGNMTNRSESIHALESMFGFLWKYLNMNEREVEEKAKFFVSQHVGDVSSELCSGDNASKSHSYKQGCRKSGRGPACDRPA